MTWDTNAITLDADAPTWDASSWVIIVAVYPDPADVRLSVLYGPNGDDFEGTLVVTGGATADPPLCAVAMPMVDQYGAPIAGVSVMIEFVSFDAAADPDAVVLSPPPVLTSDADGLVEVDLIRLGNYKAFYSIDGAVKRVDFLVPDAGSYVVVEPN